MDKSDAIYQTMVGMNDIIIPMKFQFDIIGNRVTR